MTTNEKARTEEIAEALLKLFPSEAHVQIGERLTIGTAAEVDELKKSALKAGKVIKFKEADDWVRQWVDVNPVEIAGAEASDRYVWHEDGNRIRCRVFLVTMKSGRISRELIRRAWIHFDKI